MSKYKKGDKFVIEIAERHTHYTDDGKEYNLYRIKGFNSLVFDDNGLDKCAYFKKKISTKEYDLIEKIMEELNGDK